MSGLGFVMCICYGLIGERLVECVHLLIQITVVIAILDPRLTLLPTPSSSSIPIWVQCELSWIRARQQAVTFRAGFQRGIPTSGQQL